MLTAGCTPKSVFWGTKGARKRGAAGGMPAAPLSGWSECEGLLLDGDPPSDFGSVGTAVLPIVTAMPVALTFTTKACPPTAAVPSPMSSVPVPFTVTLPSGLLVELVIHR